MKAVDLIAKAQMSDTHSPGTSDTHSPGTLTMAAMAILSDIRSDWPWQTEEALDVFETIRHQSGKIKLVVAAALIATEIDNHDSEI